MGNVVSLIQEDSFRSKMETEILTVADLNKWTLPPFQRPLRENNKVREIAEQIIAKGGIIPGTINLGNLPGDPATYLVDGQHRRYSATLTNLPEFIADLRTVQYESLEEMADEFMKLNDHIVRIEPDDRLRAMETYNKSLQLVRKYCKFIGYSNVRRGMSAPLLSMAASIRAWRGSNFETPNITGSLPATKIAQDLTMNEAEELVRFLLIAYDAWGHEVENYRMWGTLNLCMCMWMWRRLVVDQDRLGSKRYTVLGADQFKNCLMSISANFDYNNWLVGRSLSERDRAPCYKRLRTIFYDRMKNDRCSNLKLPTPLWYKG